MLPVALGLLIMMGLLAPLSAARSSSTVSPAAAVSIDLYGSGTSPNKGWGRTPNSISNSLTITVAQGDVITFHLFSNDSMAHKLIIDLNNNQANDSGEPYSPIFSSPTTAKDFSYTANTAGTFDFFCELHGYVNQHGTLVVTGASSPPPSGDNTLLIVGGVIVLVVVIAGAAAAMRMRKKQPPQQP
ncbi:MAG: hypothetical protein E6K19_05905 [Methanobacteriota archaeon]|nr:MAG: hypothetical protein E6K19_05905 [Euryarchaeota archaeon]